jgi:DnaJ-domain-containing protein 1
VWSLVLPDDRREVIVLRRGRATAATSDRDGRELSRKLARLASTEGLRAHFDGGVSAYPPGAGARYHCLARWARGHLENQLDAPRARLLAMELAGMRLCIEPGLEPDDELCDATDRRILEAMKAPRRLDQIWPLAHAPRFRLLLFVHFLRGVGALRLDGVAAPSPIPPSSERSEAHRVLGVEPSADRTTVKRAYRRLARALHPDLNASLSDERRRALEEKLAVINSAYRRIVGGPPPA